METRLRIHAEARGRSPVTTDITAVIATEFMTERDTERERGELPHSKLAGHIVIKNNFCETNLHLL